MVDDLIVLAMVALGLTGCAECVTEGCDALRDRAPGHQSGIGGVIASQSDVVANGCQECGFAEASIDVFRLEAAIDMTSPLARIAASTRYNVNLEPATYLVCVTRQCLSVRVVDDAVTTVNVKQRFGPTSFFVVETASNKFEEQFGFEQVGEEP